MSALASYLVAIGWNSQEASFVGVTQADGLTATGTTQGTALLVPATINHFTTVAVGAAGARLPPIAQVKHAYILVANSNATTLNLYPATGEEINQLGTNAPTTVTINRALLMFPVSSTRWVLA